MIQIAGDIDLPGWSGTVQSLQNSLTLQGSQSGNVIIGNTNDLLPAQNLMQDMGSVDLRWLNSFVSSGNYQVLTVNGSLVSGVPNQQFVVYVGKHGDDANTGFNVENAVLSFGKAVSIASGLVVNPNQRISILCGDGGLYTEGRLFVPSGVTINAPAASYSGILSPNGGAQIIFSKLYSSTDAPELFSIQKLDADGTAIVEIDHFLMDGSDGVSAEEVNSTLILNIKRAEVRNSSTFVGTTTMAGHVIVHADEIFFTEADGFAFANFGGIIDADIGRIYETGAAVGFATMVLQGNALSETNIYVNEVNVGTLYDMSNGKLRIYANQAIGSEIDAGGETCLIRTCDIKHNFLASIPVDARPVSGNIIPSTDDSFVLGSNNKRFKSVNTVLAKMSGLIAQEDSNLGVSGHLIPFDDNKYSIGLTNKRWAVVNAQSGNFDASVTVDGDITSGGNVGGVSVSATVGVFTTLAATLSLFTNRPELLPTGGFNTGSGVAAVNEIRHYDRLGVNSSAATQTLLSLLAGPSDTAVDPVVLTEDFLLRPSFGVSTRKNGAGAGTWVAVLRKFPANGGAATNVASGFFTWAAASATRQTTIGLWSPTSVTFAQGDAYGIVTHNDGSGVTVSSGKIDFTIGWQVNHPNLGRGV